MYRRLLIAEGSDFASWRGISDVRVFGRWDANLKVSEKGIYQQVGYEKWDTQSVDTPHEDEPSPQSVEKSELCYVNSHKLFTLLPGGRGFDLSKKLCALSHFDQRGSP